MAKKNTLVLFFLLAINGFLLGQQLEEEKTKFYQIGLNVGPLWTNIIHHKSAPTQIFFPIFETHEVLSFKYRNNRTALRLGAGVQFIKQQIEDNTNTQSNFLFRVGIEKQKDLTEKWQCFYGIDSKLNIGKIKNDFDDDPYRWHRIGLSNFLGIQYRLTSRLILQTEAAIVISHTTIRNSNQFFIDPIPIFPIEPGSSSDISKIKDISIVLPNLLYLAFEF